MKAEKPDQNTIVYFDGRFVPLAEAHVNILTHALNYGTGVFEGIRGYWNAEVGDLFLVRPVEHYERWKKNTGILRIGIGPSAHELTELTAELCRRNGFREHVYVRPLAYKASARIGVAPDDNDAFSIVVVPFGAYFEKPGLNVGVVSWRRVEDNAVPGRGKICGAYVNSCLATDEARRNGFDEAVILTEKGYVAEGATCNLFIVRNGRIYTPPPTDNILEGITRASIIELAQNELHLDVVERSVGRTELYICDEVFFTGTAVEVAPVISVDRRPVGTGDIGPITARIRDLYVAATRGKMESYSHWLRPVHGAKAAGKEPEVVHVSQLSDRFIGVSVK
jgi:branched-chain amino acid aminotransferase